MSRRGGVEVSDSREIITEDTVEEAREAADRRLEDTPLTRPEYMSVMVHFYRAEVYRSTSWRRRLDATTNWAVLTCAGMLSFAFASPRHSHILLLLSNLIIFAYLLIEGRRYRFFEIYRARVRMLEENFLLPIITRKLESPKEGWGQEVSSDLDEPKFKSSFVQAVGFRLRRNYLFIFSILLGAWCVKLGMHPTMVESFSELWERAQVGHIPGSLVIFFGLVFYGTLLVLLRVGWSLHGDAPTDEVAGVEPTLEGWKL